MSLRVGIIGAGQAGERQAIGFNSVEGVSICGVADLAAHRAQEVAEPFGAPVFTDWHALLDARPDIVAVCLPHNLHVAPAEAASSQLLKEKMEDVLENLTEREKKVLQLRFGLEDGRSRTLEEVGQEFGVTRERIRQIEAKALRKLRHPTRSKWLKDYWMGQ